VAVILGKQQRSIAKDECEGCKISKTLTSPEGKDRGNDKEKECADDSRGFSLQN
jgi:hypothetical protein